MEKTIGQSKKSGMKLPDISDPRFSQKDIQEFVRPFVKGKYKERLPHISFAFINLMGNQQHALRDANELVVGLNFRQKKDIVREVMMGLCHDYLNRKFSGDVRLADYYFDPVTQVLGGVRDSIIKMPAHDRHRLDKEFMAIGPDKAGKRMIGYIRDYLESPK